MSEQLHFTRQTLLCIPVMLTLSSRDCGPFMLEILTILSSDCDPPR